MEKDLKLIIMPNIKNLGMLVNQNLKLIKNEQEDFYINMKLDRFSNGEGKATLIDSVRGKKVFILSDIGNYGKESMYTSRGNTYLKSPDDHFQDIKRVISAIDGKAESLYVITPLLYQSRQDKKPKGINESLDCKEGLQELENRNVDGIITFDVHNPVACENALKTTSFDNLFPTHLIINSFLENVDYDPSNTLVIAPDKGAMERAIYYANTLSIDVGMFYKRRDYSKVIDGKNPIVEHKYLGNDVNGKDLIIVDDMIASGNSILEVAKDLKEKGAKKIYLITTFPLFTEGQKSIDSFDKAYENNLFEKLYTTNVTYVPEEIKQKSWYQEVDMSEYLAKVINAINEGDSIKGLSNDSKDLKQKLKKLGKYPSKI